MRLSSAFLRRLETFPSRFQFRCSSRLSNEGEKKNVRKLIGGTEFAQHRKYGPGDDIRYIDWKLYARFRSFYVKNFSEEISESIHIMVDVSRSMDFGSPNKFDSAMTLAAGLSLLSLRALDRISIYLWDTQIRRSLINLRGVPSFPKVVEFLESARSTRNSTNLEIACRELISKRIIPGPIWIISDFYDANQFDHALSLLSHHRFLPLPIRVLDRNETSFINTGNYTLIDSETGRTESFSATKSGKKEYAERFERFNSQLCEISRARGVILREMMTDFPTEEFLMRLLRDYQ